MQAGRTIGLAQVPEQGMASDCDAGFSLRHGRALGRRREGDTKMTTIDERRGWLARLPIFRGRPVPDLAMDAPRPAAVRRPAGYLAASDAERVIDGFLASIADLSGIRAVSARTAGGRVDFRVLVDGKWDEAIDAIEPRVRPLLLSGAVPFDYCTVETAWGESDPPGFVQLGCGGREPAALR